MTVQDALASLKARAYPHMLECERRFVDEFPHRPTAEHMAGVRNLLRRYSFVLKGEHT